MEVSPRIKDSDSTRLKYFRTRFTRLCGQWSFDPFDRGTETTSQRPPPPSSPSSGGSSRHNRDRRCRGRGGGGSPGGGPGDGGSSGGGPGGGGPPGGGGGPPSGGSGGSRGNGRGRRRMSQDGLQCQMDLLAQDARQRIHGRQIRSTAHSKTITTVYEDRRRLRSVSHKKAKGLSPRIHSLSCPKSKDNDALSGRDKVEGNDDDKTEASCLR